jgi:serine/threonine-protein kinase RsbT
MILSNYSSASASASQSQSVCEKQEKVMSCNELETLTFDIRDDTDVAYAALGAQKYAEKIGFNLSSQYMISTAVSELARNIFVYAKKGTIIMNRREEHLKSGIEVVANDTGPGIENIEQALEDEFSTGGTMGVGLPGTRRLMDEFEIDTSIGKGTRVVIRKWI